MANRANRMGHEGAEDQRRRQEGGAWRTARTILQFERREALPHLDRLTDRDPDERVRGLALRAAAVIRAAPQSRSMPATAASNSPYNPLTTNPLTTNPLTTLSG